VSNVSFSFISFEKLQEIEKASQSEIDPSLGISGSDVQYILFTSGSTGAPKGVMQTARTIDCTFEYFNKFIPEGEGLTFFNRTHFSFDVSLFDLCIALTHGHTMFALAENEEASLAKTFAALEQAEIDLWVSTPSFLDMCLVDPSFNSKLLPKLRSIVVCGETLHNKTASVCLERFPNAALYNTYGPTETQAITDVQITAAMAARAEALPIGTVSPFNKIEVVDVQTGKPLAAGQIGEIVILGSTIARGYFGRPDLTAKSFGEKSDSTGQACQFYKTGDEGFLDEEGMLHYLGRLDLQVKINGFRIELEEIEHTLEEIPWVLRSCVVPVERGGVNTALAAHVVISNEREPVRETTKEIKAHLKETLPAYMIPRTVTFHDSFPQNVNGKVDRKALAAGVIGKKACGEASLNANSQS
jgi:D-alanine--poly(phosphoribitol) ligase subunit 1